MEAQRKSVGLAKGGGNHRVIRKPGAITLADARSVDEAKEIHNQAVAMQVYARQAKDMQLIAWATEIRMRAVRLLGQLMAKQRDAGLMAKGGWPVESCGSDLDPQDDGQPISLAEAGIDKHLADKARKFAALPEEKFEALVARKSK